VGANDESYEEKLLQRIWDKTDRSDPDGCWLFSGGTSTNGYPLIYAHRKMKRVRNVIWRTLLKRHVKWNHRVVSTCDNRTCVNPDHLVMKDIDAIMREYHMKQRPAARETRKALLAIARRRIKPTPDEAAASIARFDRLLEHKVAEAEKAKATEAKATEARSVPAPAPAEKTHEEVVTEWEKKKADFYESYIRGRVEKAKAVSHG